MGKSGSGKSSLVSIILGLIKPVKLNVKAYVDAAELISIDSFDLMRISSYVPQKAVLLQDTIANNIDFYSNSVNLSDLSYESSILISCAEFAYDLPASLDTIVSESNSNLSGGQTQRIGLARAIQQDRFILVADEITSSLDFQNSSLLLDRLHAYARERNKIVLFVTHKYDDLAYCDYKFELLDNQVKCTPLT